MKNLKEKLLSLGVFLDNEYLDFYCTLIINNKSTKFAKRVTEKHHIIQRSYYKLKGLEIDNSDENMVYLSHFDHCLAHYYLCECTTGRLKYSNEYAFIKMVKIESRFDFDLDKFMKEADKYDEVYKSFCQHQADLNASACKKRGGGTIAGRKCFTNGEKTVFAVECPEGFWPSYTNNKPVSTITKQRMSEAAIKRCNDINYKEKQKAGLAEYYKTHVGIATGKVWITNDLESKYISKEDPLPDGWHYGRKKWK